MSSYLILYLRDNAGCEHGLTKYNRGSVIYQYLYTYYDDTSGESKILTKTIINPLLIDIQEEIDESEQEINFIKTLNISAVNILEESIKKERYLNELKETKNQIKSIMKLLDIIDNDGYCDFDGLFYKYD